MASFDIADPFIISSYPAPLSQPSSPSLSVPAHVAPSRVVRDARASPSLSKRSRRPAGTSRDQVLVTAQGEGWAIYNIASQTPLSSHALPPKVCFGCACAGLSVVDSARVRQRYIYGVAAAYPTHPDLAVREGRAVLVWVESETKGGFGEGKSEYFVPFEAKVRGVSVLSDTTDEGRVVVAMEDGKVLLCPPNLRTVTSATSLRIPIIAQSSVWIGFVDPADLARWKGFVATDRASSAVVIQRSTPQVPGASKAPPTKGRKRKSAPKDVDIKPAFDLFAADLRFSVTFDVILVKDGKLMAPRAASLKGTVLASTLHPEGCITSWRSEGMLSHQSITLHPSGDLTLCDSGPPLVLAPVLRSCKGGETSLVAIPSSTESPLAVLFARLPSSDPPTLTSLLIDLRFHTAVAASTHPLPGSLFYDSSSTSMRICATWSGGDAVLLGVSGPARSVAQASTIGIPAGGATGASAALGPKVRRLTSHWIGEGSGRWAEDVLQAVQPHAGSQSLAAAIVDAWKGEGGDLWTPLSVQAAEQAWKEWMAAEMDRLKKKAEEWEAHVAGNPGTEDDLSPTSSEEDDADGGGGYWRARRGRRRAPDIKPRISHQFARAITRLCLYAFARLEGRHPAPSGSPYPSAIIRDLIRRGAVAENMVEGGVSAALRHAGDLATLDVALLNMADLSESSFAATLRLALASSSVPASSTSNLSPSPVHRVLSRVVGQSLSPGALRIALAASLNVTDVVKVLQILAKWMDAWSSEGFGGPGLEAAGLSKIDPGRARRMKAAGTRGTEKVPSMLHIVGFTAVLLDAHFVPLLLHQPAHALLYALRTHIAVYLAAGDTLLQLAAPLGTFTRARQQNITKDKERQHLRTIGVTVEDGEPTSNGAPVSRRKQLYERNLALGNYALETFEL